VQRTFSTRGYTKREPSCQERRQEYSHKTTTRARAIQAIKIEARISSTSTRRREGREVVLVEEKIVVIEDSSHRKGKKYHHHSDKKDESSRTERIDWLIDYGLKYRIDQADGDDGSKGNSILIEWSRNTVISQKKSSIEASSWRRRIESYHREDQVIEQSKSIYIIIQRQHPTVVCSDTDWIDSTDWRFKWNIQTELTNWIGISIRIGHQYHSTESNIETGNDAVDWIA